MYISLRDNYYNAKDCDKAIAEHKDYYGSFGIVLLVMINSAFLRRLLRIEQHFEIVFANGRLFVLKDA